MAFDVSCAEMLSFVEGMNLRIINTSGSLSPGWHDQGRVVAYRRMATQRPDRFAWITGFDAPELDNPNYWKRVEAQLAADFAAGAIGCKLWRHVGMSVRKPGGEYLLMDDPAMAPLYECLIEHRKTLLVHISEPWQRWPQSRGKPTGLYGRSPARWPLEDEYGEVDFPGPAEQIAAQNRVLARYPELKVVGAHFGGLEHDVRELARQLDGYPNFAVDTSARRRDIALQALKDVQAVREFFIRYKDRILWGMDQGTGKSVLSGSSAAETVRETIKSNREGYAFEFTLYEKGGTVTVDQFGDIPGLKLPEDVLQAMYVDNARAWYPGVFEGRA
jgi:predicted TIM-barrel fold metal-dependent hydrolase